MPTDANWRQLRKWLGWHTDDTMTNQPAYTVKLEREDVPKFKRIYKTVLPCGISMAVTARSRSWSRSDNRDYSGELTYKDQWVTFEPSNPARRILDKTVAHQAAEACAGILRDDKRWIKAEPSEFTDDHGQRWIRA